MWYQDTKNKVIRFSKTKDVQCISDVSINDLITIALQYELYDVLLFVKNQNLESTKISGIITFHFVQSLIEENSTIYNFLHDNFHEYIDYGYLYPSAKYLYSDGIYSFLNMEDGDDESENSSYSFLQRIGVMY